MARRSKAEIEQERQALAALEPARVANEGFDYVADIPTDAEELQETIEPEQAADLPDPQRDATELREERKRGFTILGARKQPERNRPGAANGIHNPAKPLWNHRWEAFAQYQAKGTFTQVEAYILAGFKNSLYSTKNAYTLAKNPVIASRTMYLAQRNRAFRKAMNDDVLKLVEEASRDEALTRSNWQKQLFVNLRIARDMQDVRAANAILEMLGKANGWLTDALRKQQARQPREIDPELLARAQAAEESDDDVDAEEDEVSFLDQATQLLEDSVGAVQEEADED